MIKFLKNFWLIFFAAYISFASSQTMEPDWNFWKEKEGVSIYTKERSDSNVKSLRMETIFEGNLASFIGVLKDMSNYGQWVYASKEAFALEKISNHETIYYTISDFPWPLSDRDFVLYNKMWIDQHSKTFYSESKSIASDFPKKNGVVRVDDFHSLWKLSPIDDNSYELQYTLTSDPGGAIPSWLINMALDIGPYNTLKSLQELCDKDIYRETDISEFLIQ